MRASIFLWLVAAILLFWCVGVYNRLMRVRARGFAAFGSVEKHLKTFDTLLQTHFHAGEQSGSSATVEAEPAPADWDRLMHLVKELDAACKAARATPLQPQALEKLGQAIDVVMQEWQRISTEPADLAGSPVPDEMRAQWEDASTRALAARAALNLILQRYDEAMQEFPARLIVGVLGFKRAGTL